MAVKTRKSFSFTVLLMIFSFALAFSMPAAAQQAGSNVSDNVTINDLAGNWRIERVNRPNDPFNGEATIPPGKGDSIEIELITEDRCCGGNYARVLQKSQLTIEDGNITVSSEIVKYLIREEIIEMGYSPDDFELRRVDKDTLLGTMNGYASVRWVRGDLEIS